MDCFARSVNFVIQLVSLGENLFTTYYFDEEYFTPIYLALIFCFEPIIESCIKQLLNCTECDWDNFIFDILSEGLQCFLYIFFCSYSDEAKLWLPIMMAVQVFLMIVLKIKEKCCDAEEQLTQEQKDAASVMQCFSWCQGNCVTLVTSLFPLFFLLYQADAPYRQKTFEMILTGNYWLADVSMQNQMQAMEDAAKGDSSRMLKMASGASWTVKITTLGQVAFMIYTYVLAWMYWFSPEIDKTFDKVYTMITMVSSCTAVCWLPFLIFKTLCGGGMMPGGGDGMDPNIFGNPNDDM